MDINEEKRSLEELGVHDLRNIARMWGVKSPTTKVKNELVDNIVKIMESNSIPANSTTKKGRPTKSTFYNSNIDNILPNYIREFAENRIENLSELERNLVFCSPQKDDKYYEDLEEKNGYIRNNKNCYYFIDTISDKIIYIPNIFVAKLELEIGDFVVANCAFAKEKLYIVKTINQVNDKDILNGKYKRNLCLQKDIKELENPFEFDGLKEGSRKYYQSQNVNDFQQKISPIITAFKDNNFCVNILSVKISVEDSLSLSKIGKSKTFFAFNEDIPLYSYEAITNAIRNSLILAREGKKVVLIVYDLKKIYSEVEMFFKLQNGVETDAEFSSLRLTRQLIGINKTLSNNGSLTLILTSKEASIDEFE